MKPHSEHQYDRWGGQGGGKKRSTSSLTSHCADNMWYQLDQIQEQVMTLKKKMDHAENQSRCTNVCMIGIPEQHGESRDQTEQLC